VAVAIVLDPSEVAGTRTQVTISNWAASDVDWGQATIDAYMSEAARGNVPVDFRVPNRVVSIPLRLRTIGATSFDTIRSQIQAKVGLFQREGGWLKRTSTLGDVFADVVNASLQLGGVGFHETRSMDVDGVLTLECLPDWYQAEVDLGTTSETTLPEVRKVMATVKGNYPCRVRIVVNENDADSQLGLIWGIRSANYSAAATAALAYEAEALTPLDTAAITALTGASGAGSNTMRHNNLSTGWTPVLSTQILSGSAHMTHRGSYRVWARVYTTSTTPPRVRFLWDVGDFVSPVENAAVTIPGASNFYAVDLGPIRLDATTGTHRWQGMIQAKGASGGENVYVDRLWLVPTDDGYGVLRAPVTPNQELAAYSARDEFNQTAGNLNSKVLPVGGSWVTSGAATDLAVVAGTSNLVQRTVLSEAERYAIAGTTSMTATAVRCDFQYVGTGAATEQLYMGLLGRWTDANNHMRLQLQLNKQPSVATENWMLLQIEKRIGGAQSYGGYGRVSFASNVWYTVQLVVDAAGRYWAWMGVRGSGLGDPVFVGQDSVLATGGSLASGKFGFFDWMPYANVATRSFDNFAAWVPTVDAVLYASQSAELHTEGMFREDSTGTAYGPVSHVVGSLPRLPPSGLEGRSVELFVKDSRGDFDQLPDTGIDDSGLQVLYRPSWLQIPES
jgi:hypothetical protein